MSFCVVRRAVVMAVGACAFTGLAHAATLNTVPMQGPMVHVGIRYADHGHGPHFHIHIDPVIPTLTPLSVSHPGDSFNPIHPWYSDLDPSQEGRAFNRQYGFVLDGDSEPLPTGYGIWLRQISATPGLEVYRYRATPPTWEPIFGTDGSSDTFAWNLAMFHPAYTAPAPVGMLSLSAYSATYEAILVDASGNPTNVREEFTLYWNIIPEPSTGLLTLLGVGASAMLFRRRS
ncbi:MAG: PEP-CTERM sorting domain-containing protein [Verrucomicrobiae bacterium]|nr:PEP-CTERM sorting domain-containing protein [Verrucomicrobiae bacterium]